MWRLFAFFIVTLFLNSCYSQPTVNQNIIVGGPCEDCAAALDYLLLNPAPKSVDTITGFLENTPKIKVTGTVFTSDGTTPAENIILYVYQTDRNGLYTPGDDPVGWEYRHGKHREWLKTGANGEFTFYTFRPAAYPDGREPEHIHLYIKEPDKIPYYIDNYIFEDDPALTQEEVKSQQLRGGSGLVKLTYQNGILTAERNIILGLNIPDYID